ncbi:MAG TPA: hypothetical protein RMH99_24590 [Sandaracinaceae bacterium LLY-WYZ-13_1]|nr:hypothetical protein [Sandaracinaceae bacterium LLY-WYZ-13_1]
MSNAWSIAIAASLLLGGCCAEGAGTHSVDASVSASDASPGASLREVEATPQYYPVCTVDDASRCPPVDEEGHRGTYGFSTEGACREACQCRHACETLLDCPLPHTGTSSPECVGGTCMLPCDHRFRCPAGMACVEDESRGSRWCMWVHETGNCRPLDAGAPEA